MCLISLIQMLYSMLDRPPNHTPNTPPHLLMLHFRNQTSKSTVITVCATGRGIGHHHGNAQVPVITACAKVRDR